MRILMLSWEYPPKIVGGLAPHVHGLAGELVQLGHEVHVITQGGDGLPEEDNDRGVIVHRIQSSNLWSLDFIGYIHHLNFNFVEKALDVQQKVGSFDVIHCHDWLAAFSARSLKHSWGKPLVATIHATEWGRHNGLHNDLHRYISQIEWWLCYEAKRIVVCSQHMYGELERIFQIPGDKIEVIPNGVHLQDFQADKVGPDFQRSQFAADHERILFYVGRLVWEKGIQVLIQALPELLIHHRNLKVVIAGTGTQMNYLRHLAYRLGVGDKVLLTGYIEESTKVGLMRNADVAVFPSYYEPFGIVALEAMAAGTPVVASDTGGLSEIINHGHNGLKAYVNQPSSLTQQINRLLSDPGLVDYLVHNAMQDVQEVYAWSAIAAKTATVYDLAVEGVGGGNGKKSNIHPIEEGRKKLYQFLKKA
ncbi:glycosyltransferase family 4 protein [Heliorestis acidaminivorans]|uniref:Glycosyltransferase family 4 protein n=1 Tax=Heliorestis acidaminivorans TaxID=553427 RepID=A0A6I0F0X1_9FIRM|nr:glycosyltransferase family 4 protein [Heliorestis acidaminivorans]KAB2952724.1 glycosyltransferase family 4 protein [Heliorestis acidaminivorans]